MKYFHTYEEHKHDYLNQLNRSSMDNNFVGAIGHTFNKKEPVKTQKEAEKILKDKGVKWEKAIEGRNGWVHYRHEAEWTKYQVGIDPKTSEPYNSMMTVAAFDPHGEILWTEPTDQIKDYTKDPHITK